MFRAGRLRHFWALLPALVGGAWVTLAPPRSDHPAIRSDGAGYYVWTHALIHGDFGMCRFGSAAFPNPGYQPHNPRHPERCMNRFSPGLAVLRFPVMGPVAALSGPGDHHHLDVSGAEEAASRWTGVLGLIVGLALMLAAMLRAGVPPPVANLVTLAVCFGTGWFHYATYDGSFAHAYVAALFSGLILIGAGEAPGAGAGSRTTLFALSLFITWIRLPDLAALLALLGAWVIWRARRWPAGERLRPALQVAIPVLGGIAAALVLQAVYVRWASGSWGLNSYGPETFHLDSPRQLRVLVSFQHGLFLWYPVVGVLLAVTLAARGTRGWGLAVLGVFVPLTVIYGFWDQPSLGGSMGSRGFVDVMPLLGVVGALGVTALRPWGRRLTFAALAICTLVTLELMAAYWTGTLPAQYNTVAQFWSAVVGRHSLF
jgi:hypothetical protein